MAHSMPVDQASGGAAAPGTATATFLMTDIVGSTRLWEQEHAAMTAALAAHDAILHDAVVSRGGLVIKTTGDGLLARFDDAAQAVGAANDGQLAVAARHWELGRPLRVRMAVHSGGAQSRDGDYFGPALNRVARLLALGHGGQVLLSGVAAVLAGDRLGPALGLRDLGEHRLRDLDQPEHVYQLTAPGLQPDFPPLRSAGAGQTNLPVQLTSFVGRQRELASITALLGAGRLVTLIGTGGTGKSRLMLQVASGMAGRHRDGAWFVELAPISDPTLVAQEVARALGVRDEPGRPLEATLVDYLRFKDALLLVDNCEHLISPVADLLHQLLSACPSIVLLASSREALGIDGEAVFQVPSLSVPPPLDELVAGHVEGPGTAAGAGRLDAVMATEAGRLFVERATAAAPDFALTAENAAAVAAICRRLDGIPLAIELAAARVTVLSPQEIATRLGDRFRLLTGGRRTAMPRQQTLQALIDWSWDLLGESDRRLLRRLSVFAGGWTLDAAAAVTAGEPGDVGGSGAPDAMIETLDGLDRLVARSLLALERGTVSRYRMLETIRQYARDRLVESGESPELRGRHLAWFVRLGREAAPALRGPRMVEWLDRLDADADNLRAAAEWAFEAEPEAALHLCVAMELYWSHRAGSQEGVERMRAAVDTLHRLPPALPEACRERDILAAHVLAAAAQAGTTMGEAGLTSAWATEALAIARETGDPGALISALMANGVSSAFTVRPDATQAFAEEAVHLAAEHGDWYALAIVDSGMGLSTWMTDPKRAEEWFAASAEHASRSGNPFVIAFALQSRGRVLSWMGRVDEARPLFLASYTIATEIGDRRLALAARSDLAHALRRVGALDEAAAIYAETLKGWEHLGNRGAIAHQLESVAYLTLDRGNAVAAAELLGAAEVLRAASGSGMLEFERADHEQAVARLREMLDAAAFDAARRRGSRLNQEQAVARAIDATKEPAVLGGGATAAPPLALSSGGANGPSAGTVGPAAP